MCFGQEVTTLVELSNPINESSGLIYLDEKIITINDSGGNPELYEIDSLTGGILRTVTVSNASNIDWEEICTDDEFIYIFDFGNNNGTRTDLKIYRLLIADYLNSSSNMVLADTISFSYSDQTDFSSATYSTNYDAEAATIIDDSIYIFSKNWGDNKSNIYTIPKLPGTYSANKIATINPQGLVTGANFNPLSGSIILTGYSIPNFFIIELSNITLGNLSFDQLTRHNIPIPSGFSTQVEAIAAINSSQYYVTSEKSILGSSGLFSLTLNDFTELSEFYEAGVSLYPNPTNGIVNIENLEPSSQIYLCDLAGNVLLISNESQINISAYNVGVYMLKVYSSQGVSSLKIVKN